jgi:predicted outer membrane protein
MIKITALISVIVFSVGSASAESAAPTDPQIAAIVVAANQVDTRN